MSTGDVKNNIRKLQCELRKVKYPFDIDSEGLLSASWETLQPIYKYMLCQYSPVITEEIQLKLGFDLESRMHSRFLEGLYRVLRDIYQYKPPITKEQLCAHGFVERKLYSMVNGFNVQFELLYGQFVYTYVKKEASAVRVRYCYKDFRIMMCTEVVKMVQKHLNDAVARHSKVTTSSYGSGDKLAPANKKASSSDPDAGSTTAPVHNKPASLRKWGSGVLAPNLPDVHVKNSPRYDSSPGHVVDGCLSHFSHLIDPAAPELDSADFNCKHSGPRTSSPGLHHPLPPVKFDVEVIQRSCESLTDDDTTRTVTATAVAEENHVEKKPAPVITEDNVPHSFVEFKKSVEKSLNVMLSKITLLETRVSCLEHRLEVIQAKENSPIQRVKPLAIAQSPDIISKQANQILKVANHD